MRSTLPGRAWRSAHRDSRKAERARGLGVEHDLPAVRRQPLDQAARHVRAPPPGPAAPPHRCAASRLSPRCAPLTRGAPADRSSTSIAAASASSSAGPSRATADPRLAAEIEGRPRGSPRAVQHRRAPRRPRESRCRGRGERDAAHRAPARRPRADHCRPCPPGRGRPRTAASPGPRSPPGRPGTPTTGGQDLRRER